MLFLLPFFPALQNNAYHPAVVVVHNFLHSILQLHLTLVIHHRDLAADAILHQLTDGFSENIGLPGSLLALFALSDVGDQIIRLLLASDLIAA